MPRTHFARVEPIVGTSLRQARVALIGLPTAAPLVTHLAACGVSRWLWVDSGDGDALALGAYLSAQHGPALDLDVTTFPAHEWTTAVQRSPPHLIVAVGEAAEKQDVSRVAMEARVPALCIIPPTVTRPCHAVSLFPGDDVVETRLIAPLQWVAPGSLDVWGWATAAPLCAGLARAMLLRDTPQRRADLGDLWDAGRCAMTLGDGGNPLAVQWSSIVEARLITPLRFRTPMARRGNLLIAGLGSLGSVAAMRLAPYAAGMVIADPDHVDVYNPVRQAFSLSAIGRPKAQVLHEELLAVGVENVIPIEAALTDERVVADLIVCRGVTAALVATGTQADFAIARALRACDVPHVVGRCYPRARYWEAILVDGLRGPSFGEVRGHLQPGPAPSPTPEQSAAYSDAGVLEAEPATLIESGWAAAWMARFTAQLLAPPGLRERWLLELLASGRTCIVGGVGVERTHDGPAYGVALPGEIHAWGLEEVGRSGGAECAPLTLKRGLESLSS